MKMTKIEWCHSTVNAVMGCQGCELWIPAYAIASQLECCIKRAHHDNFDVQGVVARVVGKRVTSELYRDREGVCAKLASRLGLAKETQTELNDIIRRSCKCYAGLLGTMRAGHPGYADQFESPKLFPGRMAAAAQWGAPTEAENLDKPWLAGTPRLIFISDMGDALSTGVPFHYLEQEIIVNVSSEAGRKHIWLWLTKRPQRMASFGNWLLENGGSWPQNLVAMTTVTSQQFAARVDALRQVPSKLKGLSLEPLMDRVALNLRGIDWVIVGGGSDSLADVFYLPWALDLMQQCKECGTAFFLKQLGRVPVHNTFLKLADRHGGDWHEWPEAWRVRQLPHAFRHFPAPSLKNLNK
jgi:protein gp37